VKKMREKILVIEDDPKISRLLEIELKFEGFDVFFAYDGKEGLNMAKYGSYDLILLDVMLPKMCGMEVCKRIREGSQVPIIMLTAKDEISDKIVGFDYGADDYMTKPFSNEDRLIAKKALKSRKPVILVLNKTDLKGNLPNEEFLRLGIKPIIRTSAEHNAGVDELLTEIAEKILELYS